MSKWFIAENSHCFIKGKIWILPFIHIYYDKYTFLETGVFTPSFGFEIAWLNWIYGIVVQKR